MRTAMRTGIAAIAGIAMASSLWCQEPLSGELQVNELVTGQAFSGAVGMAPDGSFVVVWRGSVSSGTDTDGSSIQARRFDPAGGALDDQFQVNTVTTGAQTNPEVAVDSAGGFLVVWNSQSSPSNDNSALSIQAQRFDADGGAVGGQFQVNSFTTGSQVGPAAAFGPSDSYVVTWISAGSAGSDSSSDSIQARRFDSAGVPVGADFQVNSYTTGRQGWPTVGVDAAGGFVIAWESAGTPNPGAQSYSVLARRFDSEADPIAADFQVNSYTPGIQSEAELAVREDGSFVVAWSSDGSFGTDSDGSSVQARRFDPAGSAIGPEFQVNSYTTSYQGGPSVGLDARGGFVVAWRSRGSLGDDSHVWSAQARQYGNDAIAADEQLQVNVSTTGSQSSPGVAFGLDGRFVVAWASDPAATLLGDPDFTLFARLYRGGVFSDGFESNDTGAWSSTQP